MVGEYMLGGMGGFGSVGAGPSHAELAFGFGAVGSAFLMSSSPLCIRVYKALQLSCPQPAGVINGLI
jgi:hypothetical protein